MRQILAASLVSFALAGVVAAQSALPDATPVTLDAAIAAVTVYENRAMVTRSCALPKEQGTFEVRIEGLPRSIDAGSLSARVEGAKLLDVRYESVTTPVDASTSPELRQAIADLDAAQRAAELIALRMAKVNDQNTLLNSIAAKTATESAKDFGSKSLEPDALAKQVMFLDEARERLIAQRTALEAEGRKNQAELAALGAKVQSLGGKSVEARAAVVTVGKSALGDATLSLNYLVSGAGWSPDYAVRAVDTGDDATDSLMVEFNAIIMQMTGEDWKDIAVTLSTAEPTRRPAPPEIEPVFLDVALPPVETALAEKLDDKQGIPNGVPGDPGGRTAGRKEFGRAPGKPGAGGIGGGGGGRGNDAATTSYFGIEGSTGGLIGDAGEDAERSIKLGIELEMAYADAEAAGGAVVNYALPRKVSIPSDAKRTRSQRIASIDFDPVFSHVARPLVDPTVYLRAKARNGSTYRLIAGTARLFVGEDSVGETEFPTVIPGAEVSFWLGGDPRIESKRVLVSKETKEQGVFGKSTVTTWKWRLDLVSAAPGLSRIEVSDRVPVSRNEQIKVEIKEPSLALSTEDAYLKNDRTRGILRWVLDMPGRKADGKPTERSISWTVQVSHPVEVHVQTSDGDPMP